MECSIQEANYSATAGVEEADEVAVLSGTCPELVEGVSEVVGSGDEGRATALVHASAALVLGPTCPYPGDELFATTPFCICQLPTAALVRGPKLPVIAPV